MPSTELAKVFEILDDIDTAMLTTRRADGHLVSRAMATQDRAPGADVWFVTMEGSGKLDEIANDHHVNLTYFNESSREWLSVSGTAIVSRDRETIKRLYKPDWGLWFGSAVTLATAPPRSADGAGGDHHRRGDVSRGQQAAPRDPV